MPALNVMHLRAFSHKFVEDSTVLGPDCSTITQGNPERMMRVLESLKRSNYTIVSYSNIWYSGWILRCFTNLEIVIIRAALTQSVLISDTVTHIKHLYMHVYYVSLRCL